MMKTFPILLLLFSYTLPAQINWVEVWADEFNYEGKPDSTKWGYDIGNSGWGNEESQYYTDEIENAYVTGGNLIIETINEEYKGADFTSARLSTKNKGDWKYGKVEVRAQIPTGKGTWSAIWMLPTDNVYGGWPNSGEIDIMENVGYDPDKIHWTIHTEAYNHKINTQQGKSVSFTDVYDDFHIYGLEWYEDSLIFTFDDVSYFTFQKESNSSDVWPFDQYMHLLLNTSVGGTWGGLQGIDTSAYPQQYKVDYVRIYTAAKDTSHYLLHLNQGTHGTTVANQENGYLAKKSSISITATADEGHDFVRWKGTYSSTSNPLQFSLESDVTVSPVFQKKGELLINGEFEESFNQWNTYAGKHTTFIDSNESVLIKSTAASTYPWDVQLIQSGINLQDGHTYLFEFTISTQDDITFKTGVGQNEDPWASYTSKDINIGDTTITYSMEFTTSLSNPQARVYFDLGKAVGEYTIDNISLTDLTLPITSTLPPYNSTDYTVFPNPCTTELRIYSPVNYESYQIYDLNGNTCMKGIYSSHILLNNLPAGEYIITLFSESTQYSSRFTKVE